MSLNSLQIEYKLNSVQMKFLRLLSKSAYQEMNYSCADSHSRQGGCMVDIKGENEMVVTSSEKVTLDVTEVRFAFLCRKSHPTTICGHNWD